MTSTTTATRTFKPEEEITKLIESLEPDKNDVEKISKVTHRCLMVVSVRDATRMINNMKKEDEKIEDEINLFHELIQKNYLQKLDKIRKELLN